MDTEIAKKNHAEKQEPNLKSSHVKEQNDSPKNEQKAVKKSKRRRSRSQTPQTKTDESVKTLQVSLKKLDEEVNGKETIKENGQAKENGLKESTEEAKPAAEVVDKNDVEVEKVVVLDDETVEISDKSEVEVEKSVVPNDDVVVVSDDNENNDSSTAEKIVTPKKGKKGKVQKESTDSVVTLDIQDSVEMEPLVINDEPDPELQFDEISDIESGKGSPVISRCNTRRSQTRNVPTPGSPKPTEPETKPSEIDLNESDAADSSTRAEVGSDRTRLEYKEDSSYLTEARERSVTETLRCLSSRRPIRGGDFRGRTVVESVLKGVKRKDRSATPEEPKKFRGDSSGMFSSPFAGFGNKSELPSSTPKLLGYKDTRSGLQLEEGIATDRNTEEKSWCAIM